MVLALVLIPILAGVVTFALRNDHVRRALLVLTACLHTAVTIGCWLQPPVPIFAGWLSLDAPGLLFLTITSAIFLAAALYAVGYLRQMQNSTTAHYEPPHDDDSFRAEPEAAFTGCLLLFLASMTLIAVSQHFGLLWVAVEASTLASAPLIYYHQTHRSLEATWKYLMVCSVGVALALLANYFLALAATHEGAEASLLLSSLLKDAPLLQTSWLKAAFILFIVGYGTKMGLAPLHYWLPDAHSESPSLVSALLSGALLNCAFLGILRAQQVCVAAGIGEFGKDLLLLFGLLSIGLAAIFLLRQSDYKRMLAYSSVEHMGILAMGVGIGGGATFGAMLHAVNHSVTKAMLFFLAGNILTAYRTKSTRDVRGVMRVLPVSGALWMAGFLAITGSPPFGPFLSEFTIFRAAIDQNHFWTGIAFLFFLGLIFVGMAGVVLRMSQGIPQNGLVKQSESWLTIGPPLALCAMVLMLGIFIPTPLYTLLQDVAFVLEGAR